MIPRTASDIFLQERSSGQFVEATLYDAIVERNFHDFEQLWLPFSKTGEHAHWDWRKKISAYEGLLCIQSFAIECKNETQGLMIVNTMKRCHLKQQRGQHLVYIEYLQSAPWNKNGIAVTTSDDELLGD